MQAQKIPQIWTVFVRPVKNGWDLALKIGEVLKICAYIYTWRLHKKQKTWVLYMPFENVIALIFSNSFFSPIWFEIWN